MFRASINTINSLLLIFYYTLQVFPVGGFLFDGFTEGCDSYWHESEGTCYLSIQRPATWQAADKFCRRQGGDLMSIHSLKNNRILIHLLQKDMTSQDEAKFYASQPTTDYWIGGTKLPGSKFQWSDGSAVTFTRFGSSLNPSQGCLLFRDGPNSLDPQKVVNTSRKAIRPGDWHFGSCDEEHAFVCRKNLVPVDICPDTGGVDISQLGGIYDPVCADWWKPQMYVFTKDSKNITQYTMTFPNFTHEITKAAGSVWDWDKFIQRRTIFIVHGFMNSGTDAWVKNMTHLFFQAEDVNVVAVDWAWGALYPDYFTAAANVRVMGQLLTKTLDTLISLGVPEKKIWCVGHSLGAHVCGFAGKLSLNTIGRITGLDPAQPAFDSKTPRYRLNKDDADDVDVIHTGGNRGGHSVINDYGTLLKLGDADFYPNGGMDQPGCSTFGNIDGCSHDRAYELFMETILSAKCIGGSMNNVTCEVLHEPMGYAWRGVRGTFYMTTNGQSVFCRGEPGATLVDPTRHKMSKLIKCDQENV